MSNEVLLAVLVTAVLTAAVAAVLVRSRSASGSSGVDAAVEHALAEAMVRLQQQAAAERDAAVQAALRQSALLTREQLGAESSASQADLAAKKDVIDARLAQMHDEVRGELARLGEVVRQLGQASAERFGQVDQSLQAHAQAAATLADSTRVLREALANPKARGQWGERMAEDVLRLSGFVENVNYVKQQQVDGGTGLPDYTFHLPKGHVLYMDVKFPLAAYLRYLEAAGDVERQQHLAQFLRDVRARVRELAGRDYGVGGERTTVDYVLLFLPNEQLTGFIHEHDPDLIDHALGQRVVLCSPLTLFAFLGVIRQAYDSVLVEQTADEMLRLLGVFAQQWGKYTESLDTVKRRLDSTVREIEQLTGPRRRQLERPLQQLEAMRRERGIHLDDGESLALDADTSLLGPGAADPTDADSPGVAASSP